MLRQARGCLPHEWVEMRRLVATAPAVFGEAGVGEPQGMQLCAAWRKGGGEGRCSGHSNTSEAQAEQPQGRLRGECAAEAL